MVSPWFIQLSLVLYSIFCLIYFLDPILAVSGPTTSNVACQVHISLSRRIQIQGLVKSKFMSCDTEHCLTIICYITKL